MEDQRRHPRIRFGFRVEDPAKGTAWMTDDISVGGCFLKTMESLPVGAKVDLVFQLPGSSLLIEAVGEVKHIRKDGMGIEFRSMGEEGKEETDRFVQDYAQYQE